MVSLNTNNAAITALRTLQATNAELDKTQKSISTGLKIGEAKDNAAYWAIATTLKSDNKSLSTVKDALGLGAATIDTAYRGLNQAKDVLDEIKSKLSIASQDGVDRTKIQGEIAELQKQLKSIATTSTFSGENWLSVDTSSTNYKASKDIVSSVSRAPSGAITVGTISVDTSSVALIDNNNNGNGAIIDSKVALKTTSGDLTVGGFAAGVAPDASALNFGTQIATGTSPGGAAKATISLGTLNLGGIQKGDKISFDLTFNNQTSKVTLNSADIANISDPATFVSALKSSVDSAVGAGNVTVAVDSQTNAITIATTKAGATQQLAAANLLVTDGDGTVTKTGGLFSTTATLPAPASGAVTAGLATLAGTFALPTAATPAAAKLTLGTFAQPTTAVAVPAMKFDLTYNGVTKTVTTAGLASTAVAADVATALQDAIDTAFKDAVVDGGVYKKGDIVAGNASGVISIASLRTGGHQDLVIAFPAGDSSYGLTPNQGLASANNHVQGSGANDKLIAGDRVSFDIIYGTKSYNVEHVFSANELGKFAVDGKPTEAELKIFLQDQIDQRMAGTVTNGETYTKGDIRVTKGNSTLTGAPTTLSFETVKKGKEYAVGLSNIKSELSSNGGLKDNFLGLGKETVGYYWDDSAATPTYASGASTKAVAGGGTSSAAKLKFGAFDGTGLKDGDTISMTVNYTAPDSTDPTKSVEQVKTISFKTAGLESLTGTAQRDAFGTLVQAAVAQSFGDAVKFSIDSTGAMSLVTTGVGSQYKLAVAGIMATDGDGAKSGAGGIDLRAAVSSKGRDASTTSTAAVLTGGAFNPSTPLVFGGGKLSFDLSVDGGAAKTVTIDAALVNSTLSTTNGTIHTAADYTSVLNAALAKAVGSTVSAGLDSNGTVLLTRSAPGANGSLSVANVTSSAGAATMSVDKIDISDKSFAALGVNGSNMKNVLTAYIDVVNTAINKVTSAASSLGSVASRIDMQKGFVDTLMDTINKGVGSLVDADMSEESTRLQALQTKQQLGVQALSIANQSAQSILSLFRS